MPLFINAIRTIQYIVTVISLLILMIFESGFYYSKARETIFPMIPNMPIYDHEGP